MNMTEGSAGAQNKEKVSKRKRKKLAVRLPIGSGAERPTFSQIRKRRKSKFTKLLYQYRDQTANERGSKHKENLRCCVWNVNGALKHNSDAFPSLCSQVYKFKPLCFMAQESLGTRGHGYKIRDKTEFGKILDL